MNLFAKLLLAYIPVSIINSPQEIKLIFGGQDICGLWQYRAFTWMLVYFLLHLSINRMKIDSQKISKAIGYAAFISSVYAWLQFLGLDQFQFTLPGEDIGWTHRAADISANIGSSFYLGTWLGMCLPFCVAYMRWWQTVVIVGAIVICQNHTGSIGSALTMGLFYSLWIGRKWVRGYLMFLLILGAAIPLYWKQIESRADGRIYVWTETLKGWKESVTKIDLTGKNNEQRDRLEHLNEKSYAITGRGIGSYEFLFERKHPGFNDPHNVYLRVLYETGLIGLLLFLGMIFETFRNSFDAACKDKFKRCLFCAFFYCCFAGLTSPLFVVEPLRFYTFLIFSLLSI